MIRLFLFLFLVTSLFGARVETFRWSNGETYISFLERNKLPLKPLFYNLDEDEKQLTEEIISGVHCKETRGQDGSLLQVFIPLNEELQIHIYKNKDDYFFETIPIISETKTEAFIIKIQNSPYQDILGETGSKKLATIFVEGFQNSLNFKRDLKKGDTLAMLYEQKYRLGQPFSMPTLKASMIEVHGKRHYVYLGADERYYNQDGSSLQGYFLGNPVKNARISSEFTKKRFHPILKKYRAHLGVDYAAGRGTPIYSAGDGRVVFVGDSAGYGKVTKIQHSDGYLTLYAHQNSFKKGLKNGSSVQKEEVIGYVGSTGLSTGPHLHFGLYKDGEAIDPLRVVQVATKKISAKEREAFFKLKATYDKDIDLHVTNDTKFVRTSMPENVCYFFDKDETKHEQSAPTS